MALQAVDKQEQTETTCAGGHNTDDKPHGSGGGYRFGKGWLHSRHYKPRNIKLQGFSQDISGEGHDGH